MMELTQAYGPTMAIIYLMAEKMAAFFFIWIMELIVFICIGMLLFQDIEFYQRFDDAFFNTFFYSMGGFSSAPYEDTSIGEIVGLTYLTIFLIVNLLMMLNFVIAILSEVFSNYTSRTTGLYLKGIIKARPFYEFDDTYGFIVCNPFPFNIINIMFLPYFYCVKKSGASQETLQLLNYRLCKISFVPMAICFIAIFICVDIILIPIAYFFGMLTKINVLVNDKADRKYKVADLVVWILIGPVF
mmetsp:Transcript_10470/g.14477  ORF Transcript_10470/g.14477 Transcript_10470/m.14477 type:complete len:243 (+) Transcript_10470:2307-3035(+)